mmetsp:Transcript_4458/g.11332  ORF Transcript_4458/g.11332 Transcript_4458/m.11332 type:complete len:295 (-) Transcript_4458:375-1259(-)
MCSFRRRISRWIELVRLHVGSIMARYCVENGFCALSYEQFCERNPCGVGFVDGRTRARDLSEKRVCAVKTVHRAEHPDSIAMHNFGVNANRNAASALELAHECSLCGATKCRCAVSHALQQREGVAIAFPALNSERTLSHGVRALVRVEVLSDSSLPLHPMNAGRRKNERSISLPFGPAVGALIKFPEAGVEVSAHALKVQMWEQPPELGSAPQRARSDVRSLREVGQRFVPSGDVGPKDDGIAGVLPLRDGTERHAFGERCWKVLQRVHHQIDPARRQQRLQLAREEILGANL